MFTMGMSGQGQTETQTKANISSIRFIRKSKNFSHCLRASP